MVGLVGFTKRFLLRALCLFITLFFYGCGFNATVKKIEKGWEIKSNRPLQFEATEDTFKGDSRGKPLIDLKAPDIVGGKVGG